MTPDPFLPLAEKYAAAASADGATWLRVRHLVGGGWEEFRRRHGLPPRPPGGPGVTPAGTPPPRTDCVHLGAELRQQECPTCSGTVRLKVMECAVYRECTPAVKLPGLACCEGCVSYRRRV